MKKQFSGKAVAVILAAGLLAGGTVGGTLAWLADSTNEITNTFTVGNIDITLTETWNADGNDADTAFDHWEVTMVPGKTVAKDPVVTVKAKSEPSYVFVKVTESFVDRTVGSETKSFKDYISYSVRDGWTALTDNNIDNTDNIDLTGVYYREVSSSESDQLLYVLKGDSTYANGMVTIPDTVTKEMLDELGGTAPTLKFKAYAVQKDSFDIPYNAWKEVHNK